MKIKFDANQPYQQDAIAAVVSTFEGQPVAGGEFEVRFDAAAGELLSELGSGNRLALSEGVILQNVLNVQKKHGIDPVVERLAGMHFSIEMETGTGKTYVYLRTMYELHRRYGWKKFVLVVPSVAIREGTLKTIELTRDHFADLYNAPPFEAWIYSSEKAASLRSFAGSNALQLLIINIDAFNKKENNVIHQVRDRSGPRAPIEYLRATNPIVILDEPQNMEGDKERDAIASLNPLFTLRYSATHRNPYNLLYRLDPVQAHHLRLVKRIEVDSVLEDADLNKPYIRVVGIKASKSIVSASLEIDVDGKGGPSRKCVTVKGGGVDLHDLSNGRESYRGYIVGEINAAYGYVEFTNGIVVDEGAAHGGRTDDLMRIQIRETIRNHFEKELRLKGRPEGSRMKVLSLFFIDRVAHYAAEDGKLRRWFEEAYNELKLQPRYVQLDHPDVRHVHGGYFAVTAKGEAKDTSGSSKADDDVYELIMRDKERLLSLDEPLKFIFSHSALREGWDNPNVFQICTLNETKSDIRKRQEIGRGLRLPVQENGQRCFDEHVNRLTIVANESYDDFARALQNEMREEFGVSFEGCVVNKRDRRTAVLKKDGQLNPHFKELWERIKHHTRYRVRFDTEQLIEEAAADLGRRDRMEAPRFVIRKGELALTSQGAAMQSRSVRFEADAQYIETVHIPDLISYIQRETELTRSTIAKILIRSGRLNEVCVNPQSFLDQAVAAIRRALQEKMIDGIKYEKIAGEEYAMLEFEQQELEGYLSRMVEVNNSIHDIIEVDSEVERRFAQALDEREDVTLFVKLPSWFTIDTPVGSYNPDWALVLEEDSAVYFVVETKGITDPYALREGEKAKLRCGQAHSEALRHVGHDVYFQLAAAADEVGLTQSERAAN